MATEVPEEVEQEMVALLVEQSDLTDTTEAARAAALMAAGGWQVSAIASLIASLKRSFGFQGTKSIRSWARAPGRKRQQTRKFPIETFA